MGFNLQRQDYKNTFVITRDEQSTGRVPIQMNSNGYIPEGTLMKLEGDAGGWTWREATPADFTLPVNTTAFNKLGIVKRDIVGTPDAVITDRGSILLEGEVSRYGVLLDSFESVWVQMELMRNFIYMVDTTSGIVDPY